MTKITGKAAAGTSWTNVFNEDALQSYLFTQTTLPVVSADKLTLTFALGGETVRFTASDAFGLSPVAGTVIKIASATATTTDFTMSLSTFLAAVRDGDAATINSALWGAGDAITGGDSNDTLRGFAGNDTIRGGIGRDTLIGDSGADKLYGGDGRDVLFGGTGADKLYGEGSTDRLVGGAGNDLLSGGTGADDMTGGSGADTFAWSTYGEFQAPSTTLADMDIIRDFSRAQGDKIDLSALDALRNTTGDDAFTFIGGSGFAASTPGQVRVQAVDKSLGLYRVEVNYDNDIDADHAFVVYSLSGALQAADFVL